MSNLVPVIAATAASTAALIAGISLVVTGRREHLRWTREALVEAFTDYTAASYSYGRACRVAAALADAGSPEFRAVQEAAQEAHDKLTETLTRLRILGTRAVVEAAVALHDVMHGLSGPAFDPARPVDPEAWTRAEADVREARDRFVDSARAAMRLRDTTTGEYLRVRDAT